MTTFDGTNLTLRGRKITADANGLICLNDIHKAAGFTKNQTPGDWTALSSTSQKTIQVLKLITGKSGNWTKNEYRSVFYAKRGAAGGTYADPRLALDYAEYLNPKLAIEVKEVFLRYKAADATLADDILDRATDAENEWAATRAFGRVKRFEYTKTLDTHGVEGFGYGNCTNAVYGPLFDATAKKLKQQKNLPKNANLRDAMSNDELVFVMMAETLAKGRIEEEGSQGNGECFTATKRSASYVRQAIEADRNDRQKPLA